VSSILLLPLALLAAGTFALGVTVSGPGSVSDDQGQITGCTTRCSGSYAGGSTVTLTPSPGEGAQFMGWSGACTGTGPCKLEMTSARAVTAEFDLLHRLTVTATTCPAPPCGGTVTSSSVPAQPGEPIVRCTTPPAPRVCATTYPSRVQVTLTAAGLPGMAPLWGGACVGTKGESCTFVMDADKSADIDFRPLSVTPPASSPHDPDR
jgi:hypothetical protein